MQAVLEAIKTCLFPLQKETFLVALSGGHDSMVLCYALLELKIPFSAAHCNYKLRGNESDEDAIFLQEFCTKNGIRLHLKIESINPLNSGNIQDLARNIRHDFFKLLIKEYHYSYLLLAHHSEDRIESFFINLMRGSGLKGLSTMPLQNDHILRPFIGLTKTELNDFAREYNVHWREDSSNVETKYHRNKIRHKVIPELILINKTFLQNASRSIQHLYESQQLLQSYQKMWRQQHVVNTPTGFSITICNSQEDLFLFEFLAEHGFHSNTIEEIKSKLFTSGKTFESHTDWVAFTDRNKIIIARKILVVSENQEILLHENQSFLPFRNFLLKLTRKKKLELGESFQYSPDHMVHLDMDKLSFPLKLRKWKEGDTMKPLGMKNKLKKLQDILTDKKVSILDKKNCYVLLSKNEIVWTIGYCISETAKVSDKTREILCIENLEIDN